MCCKGIDPFRVSIRNNKNHTAVDGSSIVKMNPLPWFSGPFPGMQWRIPAGMGRFDCFGTDNNVSHAVLCQSQGEATRHSSVPAISFLQCLDDNREADPKSLCASLGE